VSLQFASVSIWAFESDPFERQPAGSPPPRGRLPRGACGRRCRGRGAAGLSVGRGEGGGLSRPPRGGGHTGLCPPPPPRVGGMTGSGHLKLWCISWMNKTSVARSGKGKCGPSPAGPKSEHPRPKWVAKRGGGLKAPIGHHIVPPGGVRQDGGGHLRHRRPRHHRRRPLRRRHTGHGGPSPPSPPLAGQGGLRGKGWTTWRGEPTPSSYSLPRSTHPSPPPYQGGKMLQLNPHCRLENDPSHVTIPSLCTTEGPTPNFPPTSASPTLHTGNGGQPPLTNPHSADPVQPPPPRAPNGLDSEYPMITPEGGQTPGRRRKGRGPPCGGPGRRAAPRGIHGRGELSGGWGGG